MVPLAITNPPPLVASASVVVAVLATTRPAVVVAPVVVAVTNAPVPVSVAPATTTPLLFSDPAVTIPEIVPEQAAPDGQQATWPAKSAEQMAVSWQQRLGAPRLEQELKEVGQALLVCRLRICWVCGCGDEKLEDGM